VLAQSYRTIEYIIVDGKSTDGTLAVVEQYRSGISLVVSEEDQGIYDAMNKGLGLMSGEVVLFLNAGDYLYDADVVRDVVQVFIERPEVGVVYGNVIHDYGKVRKLRRYDRIDRIFFACSTICHQVVFARKEVFDKYGRFDVRLVRNADYDWLLRVFFREDVGRYYIDRVISVYDMGGMSRSQLKFLGELLASKRKHFRGWELLMYYPICLIRQRFRKAFLEERV